MILSAVGKIETKIKETFRHHGLKPALERTKGVCIPQKI
jgi:hypothetical protein